MDEASATTSPQRSTTPLQSSMSRRVFLAGAAATALTRPLFSLSLSDPLAPAFLHLAARSLQASYVHTYAITADRCELFGSTTIGSFAAFAAHPALPILYIARDCSHWQHLPRGVVETYAVEWSASPLRLLAQTPMALSATGPRSLAVSPCGRYLLASASTGRAWNAFILRSDGTPASVAIARKETGALLSSGITSSPTPHTVAFSPRESHAVGADPGSERLTLLQPSEEGIAVLSRCHTPLGLALSSPVWTVDGKYLIAANARTPSLSMYTVRTALNSETGLDLHLLDTIQTKTPIDALLAHATEPGIFTAHSQDDSSILAYWKICNGHLRVARDIWIPGHVRAIVQQADVLWLVAEDRLIRMSIQDLRSLDSRKLPSPEHQVEAVLTQSYKSRPVIT